MVKFNVDGIQNVEVSKKLPCEKSLVKQLEIMEKYTETHKNTLNMPKEIREIECLKVLYPTLFRQIEDNDRIIGRIDFLPIGFGCVTSIGGVGHYCVFNKLREFQKQFDDESMKKRIDDLYNYWLDHDVKTLYCKDVLTEDTIGRFIDCEYPLIATARLSGMMLDYPKLLDLGIGGLRKLINEKLENDKENNFYIASLQSLELFVKSASYLQVMLQSHMETADEKRKKELETIYNSLENIKDNKPKTFHEALQLFWLYALLAGVINYGRLDDYLGPYLKNDLENNVITEDDAYEYLKSLWTMIENRRTTVNGRIITGGKGRKNPEAADLFTRIALNVTKDCKYVEPQFTLRIYKDTPEDIFDLALDSLGQGATYPTLYNDDVNIPAVMHSMNVDEKTAEQYVPFGCGEFVIQGQSTGTPNACINLLKLLTIALNEGVDPVDNKKKSGAIKIKPLSEYKTFEDLYSQYLELLDYYFDLSIKAQKYSYRLMNKEISFLFTSILMDDCIKRGKAVLDGGIKYLGGTNETYGNINTSDSLYAIKHLVYEKKKYTLEELHKAALANFVGYEEIRKDLLDCDKYGNDLETVDSLAIDFYEYVAKGIRDRGLKNEMDYYLIVISNNQLNTEWGSRTGASLDGRLEGMYMNPANNPQGGADKSGPTATLNSLTKFNAKYHGGSVQNIKFTPTMFNDDREKIKFLLRTYFKKGGCQLMVTVVDKGILEDAVIHPELYPNLIVRVSGFSAIFVNLGADIQQELLSRVLYG
ncbi:pyruvate formate lyase family protein [Clostridium vincentii]|uniref:Benzylsuccinate synthase alpha subunit n=1 Tax=Clostridium vincentii TaxID=52704 RepID=A0A2T0BCD5_9CLOT|nr:pyruvate formate lyase family protein [Clostridium vincentii]PRR81505.1 Benzylsuccinate synthase alpha subunit [Clostridium vincentii]